MAGPPANVPAGFTWVQANQPGEGCSDHFFELLAPCSCGPICGPSCGCVPFGSSYNEDGLLTSWTKSITECKSNCTCISACPHRITETPHEGLEIFPTPRKGLGLRCLQPIKSGAFVTTYNGLIVDPYTTELNPCLLVVTEHFGGREFTTAVDALNVGDWGRFANHSCSPNMAVLPVRGDTFMPKLCLFALREVKSLEELTFDYNCGTDTSILSDTKCDCGAGICKGFLPRSLLPQKEF